MDCEVVSVSAQPTHQHTTQPTQNRVIDLSITVRGNVETVWRAVATGPGISSWYVPHTVEQRTGGVATARFGPTPEMCVTGRVAVWEPPERVRFDGGEDADGFAFEWTIKPAGVDTCIVRLVNTGFGAVVEKAECADKQNDGSTHADQHAGHQADQYEDQYDAMQEGWKLFLLNLKLHMEHFSPEVATPSLPMMTWRMPPEDAWSKLTKSLGIIQLPVTGEPINIASGNGASLAGTVVDVQPCRVTLLLEHPAPGTGFISAQKYGGMTGTTMVSIWSYFYGAESAIIAERDFALWDIWMRSL